ncbi:MAG: twin-arginine translocation signal domain-containing protein [Polyangiaceae bacterium]
MTWSRRSFLRAASALGLGALAGPFVPRPARAASPFKAKRVVVVGVAGGLRLSESLGMAEGATMPNLFGDIPLVPGFGDSPAGAPQFAPEYPLPPLATPTPLQTPLYTQGALVTNLRYAEGSPGHLQGSACLVSGAYNNIDNRADARAPSPTLFELYRRANNAPATDAWCLSVLSGFFRALQSSDDPEYGPRFGGTWLSPPAVMTPIVPLALSGDREFTLDGKSPLPTVGDHSDEIQAARALTRVLDGNAPAPAKGAFRLSPDESDAVEEHLAAIFGDPTFNGYFPDSFGIGIQGQGGDLQGTGDAITTYHAERILKRFQPHVMMLSLFDVDQAHADFNAYLMGQVLVDACVRHLWETIQSTDGLKDETALIVLPEHGRQLFFNGNNPDSLGRSGLDHGGGDDGDRDVWMLALGPDFKPGVYSPTGVEQEGRTSGRYETIDAIATAATILGTGDAMKSALEDRDLRPGLLIEDILQ